ncbi:MAG: hypothetical protein K2M34_01895 [Alphaproteobacteria bacterium]|nr:hypothetical protein [Alphaproteobacteria bacterium]
MRVFIISLFFALSASNYAIAAVSCSSEPPTTGCEAGCYENAGTCSKCPDGKYSPKGSKQSTDCKPCTNIPSGATSTGPGTAATTCPWTITCNAGTEWNNTQCTTCSTNAISAQSTITYDGSTTSGKTSCTSCGTGKYANDTHTDCLSYVYTITLDKNCTLCTVKNGTFYEKYDIGFSNKETGPFIDGNSFTADLSKLDTSRWFGYELSGYYLAKSGGSPIVDQTGRLVNKSATQFSTNTTLYAHWKGKPYSIHYAGDYAPQETQTCEFGKNCQLQKPTAIKSCHVFDGWKCTSGCKDTTQIIQPNQKFDDTNILDNNYQVTLTAQWSLCPNGYYCTDGKKTACSHPGTTTSNTASKCATQNTDCYISNATKFSDKNGTFTLPIGNINYQ